MRYMIPAGIGMIIMAGLLTGCLFNDYDSSTGQEPLNNKENNTKRGEALNDYNRSGHPTTNQPKDTEESSLTDYIDQMSLEEKVTQMLYVGVSGTSLNAREREMISNGPVGGVILLGGNIESTQQLSSYISSIKKANQENHIPLFLGVDEEGGPVSRIPSPLKNLPDNKAIGDIGKPALSYQVGKLLAKKVEHFGFNMNFAPVLDVNSNPDNPVIGKRSFGTNPELVSKLGIATMKGMASENVIPVIKHFPGHGDTSIDSHVNLPTIAKTLKQIKNLELIPFQKAIKEGADVVMTAHILFPNLDENAPATLSKEIITGFLRKQMGFEGLVITDDMAMGAISQNYGLVEAAVQSIQAGTDMLLITDTNNENYQKVRTALLEAVNNGTLSTEQINQSVTRVLKLKEKYQLKDTIQPKRTKSELNQEIEQIIDQAR